MEHCTPACVPVCKRMQCVSVLLAVAYLSGSRAAASTCFFPPGALQVDSDPYLVSKLRAAVLQAQPLIADVAGSTPGDCSSGAGSDTCPAAGAASSGQSPTLATQDTVPVLLSGAGHDAMAMADVTDVAMMFVRCAGGVSHNPAEYAAPRDVAAATAALATFMKMDLLYPEDNLGEDPETIAA